MRHYLERIMQHASFVGNSFTYNSFKYTKIES